MRSPAFLVVTLVAALALLVPAGVVTAAPDARRAGLSLSTSATSSQVGQPGVRVTARTSGRGKVVFKVDGTRLAKVEVKAGKAKVTLPSTLAPGRHTVTARHGRQRASTKIRVHLSVVTLDTTALTVSRAAPEAAGSRLSGSVLFEEEPATRGYVDAYLDGATSGGRTSPAYLASATVLPDGTFDFETRFAAAVALTYAPGTYAFQVFYAQGTNFSRYVVASPVTVTVTP